MEGEAGDVNSSREITVDIVVAMSMITSTTRKRGSSMAKDNV
jgi:hypothetical protein